jgi:hypothetical protein
MTSNNPLIKKIINLVFELKAKGYNGMAHLVTNESLLVVIRYQGEPVIIETFIYGSTPVREVENLIIELNKLNK